MTRLISAVAPVLLVLLVAGLAASEIKPAPAVTLRLPDGNTVQPSTYKGRVLLIDFWASWCVSCKTSFPALDTLYQREKDHGLQVLAINLDERQKDADAFLAVHPHVMPVVFDQAGASAKAFDIRGMPSSVLIDRRGNIRFTHMGYSPKVLDRYEEEIGLLLAER